MTSFDRLREKQSDPATTAAPGFWETIARPPAAGIEQIEVSRLHNFAGHTFRVRKNDAFWMLVSSIRENGVQSPLLVRPHPTIPGDYELISGHRRKTAAETIGLQAVPCVVKDLGDADATILMAESNIQRPEWLPSERASTYKAHLEATKAARAKGGTEFHPGKTRDYAARTWGITGKAFDLYIKLNELRPELLEMVDEGRIQLKAGYQLAFLTEEQQAVVLSVLQNYDKVKLKELEAKEIRCLPAALSCEMTSADVEAALGLDNPTPRPIVLSVTLPYSDVLHAHKKDPELYDRLLEVAVSYLEELED